MLDSSLISCVYKVVMKVRATTPLRHTSKRRFPPLYRAFTFMMVTVELVITSKSISVVSKNK